MSKEKKTGKDAISRLDELITRFGWTNPNQNDLIKEKIKLIENSVNNISMISNSREEEENFYSNDEEIIKNILENKRETNLIRSPVYLKYKAYDRIVGYATRYANEYINKKEWKEVFGILIGTVKEDYLVIVKDAIPIRVGGKAEVELDLIHYVDVSQIDETIYEKDKESNSTDFIVGWWHSHPNLGFFFSETDCQTQLGYQSPNPFAIGIIFDPAKIKEESKGIAALRLENPNKGMFSKYLNVDLHFNRKEIDHKTQKVILKIQKNIDIAIKELNYIESVLVKKELAQLQKNYGLVLIPKNESIPFADDDRGSESYEWNYESLIVSYEIPAFREKIENKILNYEKNIERLIKNNLDNDFKSYQQKFKLELKTTLEKPNVIYSTLIEKFVKSVNVIKPYMQYLDTDERKVIEIFQNKINKYYKILSNFNSLCN